jgi:hypothetical protein
LPTHGLGLFVGIVAVLLLHLLDLGNVLLLSLLRGDAVINGLLPRVVLGLALVCVSKGEGQRKRPACGMALRTLEPEPGFERFELALRSNMPGWGALLMSSPVPILYRAGNAYLSVGMNTMNVPDAG